VKKQGSLMFVPTADMNAQQNESRCNRQCAISIKCWSFEERDTSCRNKHDERHSEICSNVCNVHLMLRVMMQFVDSIECSVANVVYKKTHDCHSHYCFSVEECGWWRMNALPSFVTNEKSRKEKRENGDKIPPALSFCALLFCHSSREACYAHTSIKNEAINSTVECISAK